MKKSGRTSPPTASGNVRTKRRTKTRQKGAGRGTAGHDRLVDLNLRKGLIYRLFDTKKHVLKVSVTCLKKEELEKAAARVKEMLGL